MRYTIDEIRGKRTLLLASTGGHLTQLKRLAQRLGVSDDSPWLTFDTPQSRSLLAGRDVHFVPYVHPRDIAGVAGAAGRAQRLMLECEAAVSTGAGIALSVLPEMGLVHRKPAIYIESISRVLGPSLTGRVLMRLPRIGLYTQHRGWCKAPWMPGPSVLEQYERHEAAPRQVNKVFVTLGTIAPYRFDRMVEEVLTYAQTHPNVEFTWQVGCTTRTDLPGTVVEQVSDREFGHIVERSDLIIAHSGVGVAMNILDRGATPLLMARRADLDEHVDNHQSQILDYLVSAGLAFDASEALHNSRSFDRALRSYVSRERAVPTQDAVA